MRLGCCISEPGLLPALERAGADFCEVPVATLVMDGDRHAFEALAARVRSASVPALAANVFLPPDLPLCGPVADPKRSRDYVVETMRRLSRLGVRLLVFGSGTARSVPEGVDRRAALDQLEAFMRLTAEAARPHGITVVLEPLRQAESNVFNSVREAGAFLRQRQPGLRLLADLYHMMEEGESLAVLSEYADLLAHVHVADGGRRPPGSGGYDIAGFLARLRSAGYAGDCSIECRWEDQAREVEASLGFLRRVAAEAGWRS